MNSESPKCLLYLLRGIRYEFSILYPVVMVVCMPITWSSYYANIADCFFSYQHAIMDALSGDGCLGDILYKSGK